MGKDMIVVIFESYLCSDVVLPEFKLRSPRK